MFKALRAAATAISTSGAGNIVSILWLGSKWRGLTLGTSFLDGNDGFLICRIDRLKGLSFLTLCPFTVDIQASGLIVRDGRSFDFLEKRHDDYNISVNDVLTINVSSESKILRCVQKL